MVNSWWTLKCCKWDFFFEIATSSVWLCLLEASEVHFGSDFCERGMDLNPATHQLKSRRVAVDSWRLKSPQQQQQGKGSLVFLSVVYCFGVSWSLKYEMMMCVSKSDVVPTLWNHLSKMCFLDLSKAPFHLRRAIICSVLVSSAMKTCGYLWVI